MSILKQNSKILRNAAGEVFVKYKVPTSGLMQWYNAKYIDTDESGNPVYMHDLSGNNRYANIAFTDIELIDSDADFNNQPCLSFNNVAVSSYIAIQNTVEHVSGTIIIVNKANKIDANLSLIGGGGHSYYSYIGGSYGDATYATAGAGNRLMADVSIPFSIPFIQEFSDSQLRTNNKILGINSSFTDGLYNFKFQRIGATGSSTFYGKVAEILVYDHVLTGKERNAIYGYLKSKYAIL